MMASAYLPALAALTGSAIGGLTSLASDSPRTIRTKTFPEVRKLVNSRGIDPLRAFSEECRTEMRALKAACLSTRSI